MHRRGERATPTPPTRGGTAFVAPDRTRHAASADARPRLGSITSRILAINLLALLILVGGLFYLDEFRDGLVEAKIQALTTEGEIIAGAIGESAIDAGPVERALEPATVRQLLRRLIEPTKERARVFDTDGTLIADSRSLLEAGREVQFEFLPPTQQLSFLEEAYEVGQTIWLELTGGPRLPAYTEQVDQRATDYPEVVGALAGNHGAALRAKDGEAILSVAVPVQSFKQVLGALMLTADTSDIDASVRDSRLAILRLSGIAFAVTILLSLYLAGTIARPVTRLAAAARRIRGVTSRDVEIPDFSARSDEIGALSGALIEMTSALYRRLDAIEAFAADVAHEIKNPLTSLRSAVEAIDKARDEEQREQLLQIIRDDVGRIDRLLSDIADASRLDAELSRSSMTVVDLHRLLDTMVEVHETTGDTEAVSLSLELHGDGPFYVRGIEDRLGQVVRNLIDNARSFSPPGGVISLSLARIGDVVRIVCDDEGPGFSDDNMDRVFGRFYTQRPEGEAFGKHSGLGLSISRQIVEAHKGSISAANRTDRTGAITGAQITIDLPASNAAVDTP